MSTNGNGTGSTPSTSARDALRAKIFAPHERGTRSIDFFGVTIELRQPTLADILAAQAAKEDGDEVRGVIDILVSYAFVPGTNEHVFEDTDADTLKSMPFGIDFVNVTKALAELTSVNFTGASKTSGDDQNTSPSSR